VVGVILNRVPGPAGSVRARLVVNCGAVRSAWSSDVLGFLTRERSPVDLRFVLSVAWAQEYRVRLAARVILRAGDAGLAAPRGRRRERHLLGIEAARPGEHVDVPAFGRQERSFHAFAFRVISMEHWVADFYCFSHISGGKEQNGLTDDRDPGG
jgi:hypothetical protein